MYAGARGGGALTSSSAAAAGAAISSAIAVLAEMTGFMARRLVVACPEGQPAAHLIDDEQVAALAGQLGAAVAGQILGLGGEADDDLPGVPAPGATGLTVAANVTD